MNWKEFGTRLSPRNIVLIYLTFGTVWALLFNWLPVTLMNRTALLDDLEYLNHWVFIFVSAGMLYFFIINSEAAMVYRKETLHRVNRALKSFSECNKAVIRATDEALLMEDICRIIVHGKRVNIFAFQ